MSHTKEPVMSTELTAPVKMVHVLGGGAIYNADGDYLIRFARNLSAAEIDMYRRIVACVNACAGVSNDFLKRVPLDPMRRDWLHAQVQCDELLAALKAVQIDAVCVGAGENVISDAARALVDAAISNAEAKK